MSISGAGIALATLDGCTSPPDPADLATGRALDVGTDEGGDAIYGLATGMSMSTNKGPGRTVISGPINGG